MVIQVKAAEVVTSSIMLGQNVFDPSDRYTHDSETGDRIDKFIDVKGLSEGLNSLTSSSAVTSSSCPCMGH